MGEIDNRSGGLPPCHDDQSLGGRPQNHCKKQDPDINVSPAAEETHDAVEQVRRSLHFGKGQINSALGDAIQCLSRYQDHEVYECLWQLAGTIKMIRKRSRPADLEQRIESMFQRSAPRRLNF